MNTPPADDEQTLVPPLVAEDRSLRALTRLAEALSITQAPEAVLREALAVAVESFALQGGAALLAGANDSCEIAAECGEPVDDLEQLRALAKQVLLWDRPVVSAEGGPGWSAMTPIRSRARQLGALALRGRAGSQPPHREVLLALGRQVAIAVDNAQLYAELRALAARSETLARINRGLAVSLDLKSGVAELARELQSIQKFSRIFCAFLNEGGDFLEVVSHPDGAGWGVGSVIPTEGSGPGFAATNDAPVIEEALGESQRFVESERLFEQGIGSYLLLPLRSGDRCTGVLGMATAQPRMFSADAVARLQPIADAVALALDNLRLFKKTQDLAISDDVTALYNGRFLHQVLEREIKLAKRYRAPLSVVFLDLDRFKPVNDTYGHLRGSRVLREVGFLLQSGVRETDYAARYGGDEFVIVLPQTDVDGARLLMERLQRSLEDYVYLQEEGLQVRLGVSAGCATCPTEAASKEALLSLADQRMYADKEERKARLP